MSAAFADMRDFARQERYGAFSKAVWQTDETVRYIRNQAEHHRTMTLDEDYVAILKKVGTEYDERLVFG